jgi:hypothetical protein
MQGVEEWRVLRPTLVVRITNTNFEVLKWLLTTIGEGSLAYERSRVGKENRKPCGRYMIANAKAAVFLRTIRPYLIIKASHVDMLLAGKMSGRSVRQVRGGVA